MTFKFSRPFEESVVDVIEKASPSDLVCLARLIKMTRITFYHDTILAAWIKRTHFHEVIDMGVTDYMVLQKLNAQSEAHAANAFDAHHS